MVVYRNGFRRPKQQLQRPDIHLNRLSGLLVAGLGVGLVASLPAYGQEKSDSTAFLSRHPLMEARRQKADLSGRGPWTRRWNQYPLYPSAAKRMASPDFVNESPKFTHVDVASWSKPAFVDMDGDSDLDVFVGQGGYAPSSEGIVFFENIGSPDDPVLDDGTLNPFGISGTGYYSAPTMVDIDGDGDLDLFTGEYGSGFNFFENISTVTSTAFDTVSKNPFGLGSPGDTDTTPAFADINGDGAFDLFSGGGSGDVYYFENQGNSTSPVFNSSPSLNPFGLVNVGSYSVPTFVDINGDGDLDAFVGSGSGDTYYFENTGNSTSPAFSSSPAVNPFGLVNTSSNAALAFVDLDDDNDFDAVLGASNAFLLYAENTGDSSSPAFVVHWPFGIARVGDTSSPAFGDADGDGDLDALVGEKDGSLNYFENTGGATNPAFPSDPLVNPFGLSDVGSLSAPVFADVDGDGDEDVFVGVSTNLWYYENTRIDGTTAGTVPAFASPVTGAFGLSGFGSRTLPTFIDIDDDGDLDYFAATFQSSLTGILFQENLHDSNTTATPTFGSTTSNPFGISTVSDEAAPAFADVDQDGDYDLLTGGDYGDLFFYENTGAASAAAFAARLTNPDGFRAQGARTRPAFVDIDGNGTPDLFVGMRTGQLAFFRNQVEPAPTDLLVSPKVFIQGPYSTSTHAMSTGLNASLPTAQPYGSAPFTGTQLEYSGSESVAGMPATAVDWVVVQLRTGVPPSPQTVVATRAGLLLSNGSIVDTDGTSPLSFGGLTAGNYYLVVLQRNHLGVMTPTAIALSTTNTPYDFTTASSKAFGSNAMALLESGVWGLATGDANIDGDVTASDFVLWFADTKLGSMGYLITDFNFDGNATVSDFSQWFVNTKLGASTKVPDVSP